MLYFYSQYYLSLSVSELHVARTVMEDPTGPTPLNESTRWKFTRIARSVCLSNLIFCSPGEFREDGRCGFLLDGAECDKCCSEYGFCGDTEVQLAVRIICYVLCAFFRSIATVPIASIMVLWLLTKCAVITGESKKSFVLKIKLAGVG